MSHCHLLFALTLLWVAAAQESLPRTVLPRYYKLNILTDLDDFSFNGDVDITVDCVTPTKVIKLHVVKKSLEIREKDVSVKLSGSGNKVLGQELVSWTEYDTVNDFFVIHLTQDLVRNKRYDLFLSFKGELSDETEGYFKSMYYDQTAQKYKFMAMTQFHYNNARKAFPCFDEPHLKAVFSIRLAHKYTLSSLTNMILKHTEPLRGMGEWVSEEYEETPPMPTYLVSYMVFQLKPAEPVILDKVTLRFWGRPEILSNFEFTRTIAPAIIVDLQEFFGTKFTLPKIDFVAIPSNQYASFENWGIIPAVENFILEGMVPGMTLPTSIVYAMTHELTHQWLGNLVSTKSWNTFWLFEALADYFFYLRGPKVYNQLDIFKSRLATSMNLWMYMDSDEYSDFVVNDPRYDSTFKSKDTWRKGVLLLRMLHLTVGDDMFREGLRKFVSMYMYTSAGPDELWAIFNNLVNNQGTNKLGGLLGLANKVATKFLPSFNDGSSLLPSGVTVNMFMESWTNRPGYPVITVTRLSEGKVQVTQKRFIKTQSRLSEPQGCWLIPLTYSTSTNKRFGNTRPTHWLDCDLRHSGLIIDISAGKDDWVIFNNNFAGLYRVQYDDHNWALLAEALKAPDFSGITEMNRMQLLSDAVGLAWAGELSFNIFFKLLGYLRQETVYFQWRAVLKNLSDLHAAIYHTPLQDEYAKAMKPLLTPIYSKIFPEIWHYQQRMPADEGDLATELDIFDIACKLGVDSCVAQVREVFYNWRMSNADPNLLILFPVRMRHTILCNAIRYGTVEDFYFLTTLLTVNQAKSQQRIYINALSCTTNREALDKLLEVAVSDSPMMNPEEIVPTMIAVMSKQHGLVPSLIFFHNYFDKIFDLVHRDEKSIGNIVFNLGVRLGFLESLDELRTMVVFKCAMWNLTEPKKALDIASKIAMPNMIWLRDHYHNLAQAIQEASAQASVQVVIKGQ